MKLYTKPNCTNCLVIKNLLKNRGLLEPFEIIEDIEVAIEVAQSAGIGSFPFAEINDQIYDLKQLRGWINLQ